MAAAKPTSIRLIATMVLTALLAGSVLAGVYAVTAPMIAENRRAATRAAIARVLPGTRETRMLAVRDGVLVPVGEGEEPAAPVYLGLDGAGGVIGLAVPASGAGFGGTLELLFGFDPERERVTGLAILASLETPGLGDKIETDPAFTESFLDLAVAPEIVCANERTAPNTVDGISGATISSKAVVRIINERLATLPRDLPDGGGVP